MLSEQEVIKSNVTGRVGYGGACLDMAKAVSDAGHGGQVLLSQDTFSQLPCQMDKLLLAHLGQCVMEEQSSKAAHLYLAMSPALCYRTACCAKPLRKVAYVSNGFLDAPYGRATTCFLSVSGVKLLFAWDAAVAQVCKGRGMRG